MKIASLLTEFLYHNRYLKIPGIGYFFIDKDVLIPEPEDKEFEDFQQHIQFENRTIREADDALIEFIRSKTGKIKPLAIADLESFLDDCKLFINIGKPIFIEGIGTLSKINAGQLSFTPGASSSQKIDFNTSNKKSSSSRKENNLTGWLFNIKGFTLPNKREMILFSGIAVALVLLVLGGILVFNYAGNTRNAEQTEQVPATPSAAPAPAAETTVAASLDSDAAPAETASPARRDSIVKPVIGMGNFKFVLQKTTNRDIALANYRNIKRDRPDLQLETKDSISYKIFVIQKCTPADTARQKEILNYWYWGKKEMKVYIEG